MAQRCRLTVARGVARCGRRGSEFEATTYARAVTQLCVLRAFDIQRLNSAGEIKRCNSKGAYD